MKRSEMYPGLCIWDKKNETVAFVSYYNRKEKIVKIYSPKVDHQMVGMEATFYLDHYDPTPNWREISSGEIVIYFQNLKAQEGEKAEKLFKLFTTLWTELVGKNETIKNIVNDLFCHKQRVYNILQPILENSQN